MRLAIVIHVTGTLVRLFSPAVLAPALVAIVYREWRDVAGFLIALAATAIVGALMRRAARAEVAGVHCDISRTVRRVCGGRGWVTHLDGTGTGICERLERPVCRHRRVKSIGSTWVAHHPSCVDVSPRCWFRLRSRNNPAKNGHRDALVSHLTRCALWRGDVCQCSCRI